MNILQQILPRLLHSYYLRNWILTANPAISTGYLRCANQSSEKPTTTPFRTIGLLTPFTDTKINISPLLVLEAWKLQPYLTVTILSKPFLCFLALHNITNLLLCSTSKFPHFILFLNYLRGHYFSKSSMGWFRKIISC